MRSAFPSTRIHPGEPVPGKTISERKHRTPSLRATRWIAAVAFTAMLPAQGVAQTGGYAGAFTRIGFDPVGLAMGNSVSAWVGSGASAYHNPAFAAGIAGGPDGSGPIRLQTGAAALSFGRRLAAFDASLPLPPSAGMRIGLLHLGIDGIDGRTQSGYPTGELSTSELQLAAAFGLRLGEAWQAGIGIKWNSSRLHEQVPRASSLAIDLGVLTRLGTRHALALTLQDLLGSYTWDTGELYGSEQSFTDTQAFPRRLRLGYHVAATERLDLTLEGEVRTQTLLVAQRTLDFTGGYPRQVVTERERRDRSLLTRFGAAWQAVPSLTLRAGASSGDLLHRSDWRLSSGFSIHLPDLPLRPSVHYAFTSEPQRTGSIHAASFTLEF